mmetsp:Transcript_27329/g.64923  ORF Transcript_27329/g.64923 Transcript_27329/m.64923 type:complete len:309 (-) Transcript_27329:78-1004(-)
MFSTVSGFRSVAITSAGDPWTAAARLGIAHPAPSSRTRRPAIRSTIEGDASHRAMTRDAHHMPRPVVSSSGACPKGSSACLIGSSRISTVGLSLESTASPSSLHRRKSNSCTMPFSSSLFSPAPFDFPSATSSASPSLASFRSSPPMSLSSSAESWFKTCCTVAVSPDANASVSADRPNPFLSSTSSRPPLPREWRASAWSRRSPTQSDPPADAAQCRGVFPLSFRACASAPRLRRRRAVEECLFAHALWSGVDPEASAASTIRAGCPDSKGRSPSLLFPGDQTSSMARTASTSPYRAQSISSEEASP